ncbi:MAG TPA: PAS-domain containing protein [Novosphingobium sp.]|jgi:signal transduction histidine kinase|nr:PAS-domain containing protein [Novosphingobium sp.]HOA48286.1 PAS-domain containing protein [Novosphingobium sp.]HPB21552.1 PAS-domain containing protein [Novosphingobium sp.]HPZ47464.1 PAS-domain containing protein [Novosphingobium sp.]HQD98304.1 PAS-domain containing protein [Novosphingobium sp.]
MTLSPIAMVLLGLLLAAWTVAAAWAVLWARGRERRAEAAQRHVRRLGRMVDESPALPLLVRADGKIEAPQRLANWLGLDAVPQFLTELDGGRIDGGGGGLTTEQLAELTEAVRRTQRTAAPFRMVATPRGSKRSLALRGHLADPQVSPGGAALVWVFDFSDSESELVQLRADAQRAREDFGALVGLIEAAPMPMWFRGPDGALRLVNHAYVDAVAGQDAVQVVSDGIELVERVDGLTARQVALQAAAKHLPIERMVSATIGGQRRALKVSDLPLGDEGIAGYAVDVEEMEEVSRSLRAFREAQRTMLDQLSAGVAQFDARRQLTFANRPFQRIFALKPAVMLDPPPFERLLDLARDGGRVPEARDFPAWRRERAGWFHASTPQEETWTLADGTHLRIVAQPLPDGGIMLVAEDRTEQLQLSAARDTLLRTRTATFDSLFESVAVFAPDGRMQLWNRRFSVDWGLDAEFLDTHPRIETLLERIGARLAKPARAKAVGDAVRAATLDRRQTGGRAVLADGRTLEYAGVPLPDGNGLLTVLDITDSQKAEEALMQRNAALEETDAMKTRFLATMSYEFRTPLTSIGGFAELLQAGLGGDLSEQGREYVQAILTSVGRLGEQIESVLDLSQSEAGLLPLAREEIELLPFVTRLVEDRAAALREGGLSLDLRGTSSAGRITGDKRRLARALGHLIDNAIAATPPGGRILVELRGLKDRARIVVSDNGPGMDAPTLARALEGIKPGTDGQTIERGQGLGLPLARQLIEAHGGTLELLSEPGQGTAAIVELP